MKPNVELLRETLQTIKENPEHWDQKQWHCGTTHCFAGLVECKLRKMAIQETIDDAQETKLAICDKSELLSVLKANGFDDEEGVMMVNKYYPIYQNTRILAMIALGLTNEQSGELFYSDNTLEDLERIVEELCTQDQDDTDSN